MSLAEHTTAESPITPRLALDQIKRELPSDIGAKVASPRADPSEGAGDTFAA